MCGKLGQNSGLNVEFAVTMPIHGSALTMFRYTKTWPLVSTWVGGAWTSHPASEGVVGCIGWEQFSIRRPMISTNGERAGSTADHTTNPTNDPTANPTANPRRLAGWAGLRIKPQNGRVEGEGLRQGHRPGPHLCLCHLGLFKQHVGGIHRLGRSPLLLGVGLQFPVSPFSKPGPRRRWHRQDRQDESAAASGEGTESDHT